MPPSGLFNLLGIGPCSNYYRPETCESARGCEWLSEGGSRRRHWHLTSQGGRCRRSVGSSRPSAQLDTQKAETRAKSYTQAKTHAHTQAKTHAHTQAKTHAHTQAKTHAHTQDGLDRAARSAVTTWDGLDRATRSAVRTLLVAANPEYYRELWLNLRSSGISGNESTQIVRKMIEEELEKKYPKELPRPSSGSRPASMSGAT
jgi:hypothetical protein